MPVMWCPAVVAALLAAWRWARPARQWGYWQSLTQCSHAGRRSRHRYMLCPLRLYNTSRDFLCHMLPISRVGDVEEFLRVVKSEPEWWLCLA